MVADAATGELSLFGDADGLLPDARRLPVCAPAAAEPATVEEYAEGTVPVAATTGALSPLGDADELLPAAGKLPVCAPATADPVTVELYAIGVVPVAVVEAPTSEKG